MRTGMTEVTTIVFTIRARTFESDGLVRPETFVAEFYSPEKIAGLMDGDDTLAMFLRDVVKAGLKVSGS